MKELYEMKNQLSQMMLSIRQKDEIINQQNAKLNQFMRIGGNNINNLSNNQAYD